MALYIPHSIFHLGRLLYVRPETFGTYCVVIRNLIYMNRELNLDIDKKIPGTGMPSRGFYERGPDRAESQGGG